jgi:hypothetical protein
MGDRAQIIIKRADTAIHLYTHWNGYQLPTMLAKGLAAGKTRWGDDSYLTRIIFCNIMEAGDFRDTAGFGISTQYQDSMPETDLIVNMDDNTVSYLGLKWSFAEYVALAPHSWKDLV